MHCYVLAYCSAVVAICVAIAGVLVTCYFSYLSTAIAICIAIVVISMRMYADDVIFTIKLIQNAVDHIVRRSCHHC